MAKRSKVTASRGSVNNIILDSLLNGDKYGYEIIKEVELKTNGKVKLKQPSLYSSLKRFEQKGYITSYWGDSDFGGRRHYYSITPLGRKNSKANKHNSSDDETENIEEPITDNQFETASTFTEDDYLEDNIYEIDEKQDDEDEGLQIKYEDFNVDDKLNDLLYDEELTDPSPILLDDTVINSNEDEKELVSAITEAINDEENPSADYEKPNTVFEDVDDEMLYDHHFYKSTPLSQMVSRNEDSYEKVYSNQNSMFEKDEEETINQVKEKIEDISNIEKEPYVYPETEDTSNIPLIKEPNNNLMNFDEKKEELSKKKAKIITDEFGITKMVYDDEDEYKKPTNKVFDNVVLRASNPAPDYDKIKKSKNTDNFDDLHEDNREERNQKFMEKFDSITQEKTNSSYISKDYKNKLNHFLDEDENQNEEQFVKSTDDYTNTQTQFTDLQEDNVYFETPEIKRFENNSPDSNAYNVKTYTPQTSQKSNSNNSYLLINKAKFVFGIILLVLMILQITISMIVIKKHDLLFSSHFWVYQVSYVMVAIVTLYYCIPVFISPNKQATSKYKLSYSLMFGTLAFFVSLLLIYSINTFMGFDYSNINSFLTPLIVPSILATNFIFGPIIFKVITLNNKLY